MSGHFISLSQPMFISFFVQMDENEMTAPRVRHPIPISKMLSHLTSVILCDHQNFIVSQEEEYQSQWRQFQRPFVQTWWSSTKTLIHRQFKMTKRLHFLIKLRLFQVRQKLSFCKLSVSINANPSHFFQCLNGTIVPYTNSNICVLTLLFCILQAIVLGVFSGTLFYKFGGEYSQQHMNSVRAFGFVSTMSIMLINLVQLPLYMLQRPIFYKHRSQRFFRASSYTFAHCVVNLPQTFLEVSTMKIKRKSL